MKTTDRKAGQRNATENSDVFWNAKISQSVNIFPTFLVFMVQWCAEWRRKRCGSSKSRELFIKRHNVTSQHPWTPSNAAAITSNLARTRRVMKKQEHLSVSVDKKNQLDVTFCILYFSSNSCSTCFGQPCAHHQKLTTAWCYSLVLVCVGIGTPICQCG